VSVEKRPSSEHDEDRKPALRAGYTNITLPTQRPSQGLGDSMKHNRVMASREAREEVQDNGPRLQMNDGEYKDFPAFKDTHMDMPSTDNLDDEEYDEQYCDPLREPSKAKGND
jgi:hypothetical protein